MAVASSEIVSTPPMTTCFFRRCFRRKAQVKLHGEMVWSVKEAARTFVEADGSPVGDFLTPSMKNGRDKFTAVTKKRKVGRDWNGN